MKKTMRTSVLGLTLVSLMAALACGGKTGTPTSGGSSTTAATSGSGSTAAVVSVARNYSD